MLQVICVTKKLSKRFPVFCVFQQTGKKIGGSTQPHKALATPAKQATTGGKTVQLRKSTSVNQLQQHNFNNTTSIKQAVLQARLKQRPARDAALAQGVAIGFRVIGPEKWLFPAHAFGLRGDGNAFVVDIAHAAWAVVGFFDDEFATGGRADGGIHTQNVRAVAAIVVAIGPQGPGFAVKRERHDFAVATGDGGHAHIA